MPPKKGQIGAPNRGGDTTRVTKRRRTSNNVNSNSGTGIYGSGTIVAANPFDDDNNHHQHHHQQHHSQPHHQQHHSQPHHHQQHHHNNPHHNNPHHNVPPPQTMSNMMVKQEPAMHSHPQHPQQPHHVTPTGSHHMMGPGHVPVPTQPHQQNFGPPQHSGQTQMIGTSTPPHIMGPSHSPYLQQQQGMQMIAPPHQGMTPQPPHLEQMLMQQQPYNVYCGNCYREIYQNQPNIICKAGCRSCFHITCSGLTQSACDLLMKESHAEWACDRCTSGNRRVPFVKYKT